MPATKLSHSFRNLIDRTFKKNGVKKAPPPQIIVASNQLELQRSPMIRPVDIQAEYDISDAFHDPSVLDVRQNVRYGLNRDTIIEVDGLAFSIVAPALSPLLSPPSPEFSGVMEGSVYDQGTPSLTFDTSSDTTRSLSSLPIPNANASTTNGEARELSLSDLHIVRLLSQGSSGQVYHVIDKVTCERRALKVIPHLGKLAYEISSILTEQTLMRALNYMDSTYHLRLQASFCDSKNFYLVMVTKAVQPLYTTDLESEILRLGKLDVDRARFYFVETYIAITNLHKDGIIHRDIKPGNILLSNEGHVVLADFGLAHDFNDFPTHSERIHVPYWPYARGDVVSGPDTPHRRPHELCFVTNLICGTPVYMAPELVNGEYYSFAADVWALGVSLYMMVTGRVPFNPKSDDFYDMRREILQTEVEFRPEDGVDDITKDFILQLLKKSPTDRLQSTALEAHPFLAGINWPLFEKNQVPAPWIPGPYPTHICPSQPREQFTPGVAITGTNPYTAFEYTSDEVAAGVVDVCDVVKGEELPEGFRYLGKRATTTTATAAVTTTTTTSTNVVQKPTPTTTKRPSKIKAFFKKLVSPKTWFRRPSPPPSQTTSSSPPPPPPPSISLDKELPPLPLPVSNPPIPASSESVRCQWETINFENVTQGTPVLVLPSHTPTPAPAPTPLVSAQSLFQRLRAWFLKLRIPCACRVPDSERRMDLLE
ncbi:hypothetical protein H0H93_015567 [Arthromyces matolae]|nr:hypothetical protein H0H93_015567 [Arthromyces matolae]